jgi:hypothetical protein
MAGGSISIRLSALYVEFERFGRQTSQLSSHPAMPQAAGMVEEFSKDGGGQRDPVSIGSFAVRVTDILRSAGPGKVHQSIPEASALEPAAFSSGVP